MQDEINIIKASIVQLKESDSDQWDTINDIVARLYDIEKRLDLIESNL